MKSARLRLALYLGVLIVSFVAAGIMLGVWMADPPSGTRVMAHWAIEGIAARRDEPGGMQAVMREFQRASIKITIYATDGRLLASSVSPPLPFDISDGDGATFRQVVRSGGKPELVGVGRRLYPTLAERATSLSILFAVLFLLVVLIARVIGTPLQRIASAARRFGSGDLLARAHLKRNDELGEVGAAFDDMAERVTALMTAQRELMANVSHELHTPLSRIQVALDLALDGVEDDILALLPNVAVDLAEILRLIDDILTLSRFDLADARTSGVHAHLRKELVAVDAIVNSAITRFRAAHERPSLDVTIADCVPEIHADPVLLRRVIENLLDNAQKYSDPSQAIALTVTSLDERVTMSVADRGIGIHPDDVHRVFTPFFRSDRSRSRATGGFGLGLALARRVVEAHGGTISIASAPNVGTTVTFELPLGSDV